jgi:CheB methylesterase
MTSMTGSTRPRPCPLPPASAPPGPWRWPSTSTRGPSTSTRGHSACDWTRLTPWPGAAVPPAQRPPSAPRTTTRFGPSGSKASSTACRLRPLVGPRVGMLACAAPADRDHRGDGGDIRSGCRTASGGGVARRSPQGRAADGHTGLQQRDLDRAVRRPARVSIRDLVTEPEAPDAAHVSGIDLVVVGASAGGVGTLEALVGRLPADLGVAALVVLHVPSSGVSLLADILNRACPLPVSRAQDGMELERSRILVAHRSSPAGGGHQGRAEPRTARQRPPASR